MALVGWLRLLPQSLGTINEQVSRSSTDAGPTTRRYGPELTYADESGREYVYLGDFDSYLWLRYARNYLRTGTPCDAVIDGVCRDTHSNAPVGTRTIYARSLHVAAIAGLHDLAAWFRPTHPLPATAFLVPVIVGVLGVPPAFFIARRLAGTTAGTFAGVLTAIHPSVLTRTIGSDNDVWQVVLPLYMVWAAMTALAAASPVRVTAWAALAGLTAGLHAWAWRGWLFTYIVIMGGLIGAALVHGARDGIRHRTWRLWRSRDVRRTAQVLVIFYAIAGAAATIVGSDEPYLTIPIEAARAFIHAVADGTGRDETSNAWPNALSRVAEVTPLRWSAIVAANGGAAVFLGSLVGLLLLLLPRDRWRWWHHLVLAAGALVYGVSVFVLEPGRVAALAILGAPLGAALIVQSSANEKASAAHQGGAFIVIVWFLAAVAIAYEGLRFLLLVAPPFGIACAVLIGRLDCWIRGLIAAMPGAHRAIGFGLLAVVLGVALLHPVRWGHATVRQYTPPMHDGWWDALTHLRVTAAPDAIIHTWWDYGHWVTYVAERRVSNDGTSLLTQIPHWMSRALVAPSEEQSVGVLRMLGCGSDATPLPEGAQGAFGKLRASGRDSAGAYALVSNLVTRDKAAADVHLTEHGFTSSERAEILRSTHCEPPESYLVLSSALVSRRRSWMSLGLWDPRQAQQTSLSDPMSRAQLRQVSEQSSPERGLLDAPDRFVAANPPPVPFVPYWLPCRAGLAAALVCEIPAGMSREGSGLQAFTYSSAAPEKARLHSRERREGALAGGPSEGTPAAVLIAGLDQMRQLDFTSPTYSDLGVMIDVPGSRILVGALPLLQSTFVHLMYLDGRYAKLFHKHDQREARGERIVTWKIR